MNLIKASPKIQAASKHAVDIAKRVVAYVLARALMNELQ